MPRPILPEERMHPAVREAVASRHRELINEVETAIDQSRVVVVGMAQNPFCKKARRALDGKGIDHRYLEYGSYLSQWRKRNALKMWTGWPTLPMCFVDGILIGGATELIAQVESGELS